MRACFSIPDRAADASGSVALLRDALGSTIALVNGRGGPASELPN